MKSKKILIGLSILSVILAVSCKAPSKSEPLPSIGTLSTKPESSTITLVKNIISGGERSGAINIVGFTDNVKNEVKDSIDVLYTVKTITVTGVQASSSEAVYKLVPTKEEVQQAIENGSFEVVSSYSDVFDEVIVTFANDVGGSSSGENALKIANAIGVGNTASITIKVEASANASIEGKYTPSTFEIRLGIIVK